MGSAGELYILGDGHPGPNGKYIMAVAHYAVVFQADPRGAITSGLRFWAGPYGVAQDFAEGVWDLVWDIVRTNPHCDLGGVTKGRVGCSSCRQPRSRLLVAPDKRYPLCA